MIRKVNSWISKLPFVRSRRGSQLESETTDGNEGVGDTITPSDTPEPRRIPAWKVIKATARGATHERNGLPNQDNIAASDPDTGLPIVLAVADGHGGSKYFRSHEGARIAVETALEVVPKFFKTEQTNEVTPEMAKGAQPERDLTLDKQTLELNIPRKLIGEWIRRVLNHLDRNQLGANELARLDNKEQSAFITFSGRREALIKKRAAGTPLSEDEEKEMSASETKLLQAYGATLLVAAVSDRNILYWQLGDGDIMSVSTSGEVANVMPKDERLFANETTSLCISQVKDFRVTSQAISDDDEQPAMIMLSTDGYSNSYSSSEGFEKVGKDLLELMSEENGLEEVQNNLQGWLEETSKSGSGDDITVGILVRTAALKQLAEINKSKRESAVETTTPDEEQTNIADDVRADHDGAKDPAKQTEISS